MCGGREHTEKERKRERERDRPHLLPGKKGGLFWCIWFWRRGVWDGGVYLSDGDVVVGHVISYNML